VSDVRARIRARIADASGDSAAAISRYVLTRIPDGELRQALEVALPYLVRDEIRKWRFDMLGKQPIRGVEDWEQLEKPTGNGPARYAEAARASREGAAKAGAQRGAQLRQQALIMRTPVTLADGRAKQLGDCTPADLRSVATGLRRRAWEYDDRAERYERLAKALEEQGASVVADYEGSIREALVAR
jgi:hypothetical protein